MIRVRLDRLLVKKRMTMEDLAQRTGVSRKNLWVLKAGRARAIRFSTLEAICNALDCEPGDLLRLSKDSMDEAATEAVGEVPVLEPNDQRVLEVVTSGTEMMEDIMNVTGLSASQAAVALMNLELADLVTRHAGGRYSVVKPGKKRG